MAHVIKFSIKQIVYSKRLMPIWNIQKFINQKGSNLLSPNKTNGNSRNFIKYNLLRIPFKTL